MDTLSVISVSSVVNSSHFAVGIVLRTTTPGNRELHPTTASGSFSTCSVLWTGLWFCRPNSKANLRLSTHTTRTQKV